MPVVKFDVSGSDPKAAFAGGGKQATPGVYTVKLKEVKPGFRKGDNGQPDKSAPRLEVLAEIQDKKFKGSLLYDYISFSEASQWKMDQFLQVLGLASTSKRKGSFDTTVNTGPSWAATFRTRTEWKTMRRTKKPKTRKNQKRTKAPKRTKKPQTSTPLAKQQMKKTRTQSPS
jgi:hypothetical protein